MADTEDRPSMGGEAAMASLPQPNGVEDLPPLGSFRAAGTGRRAARARTVTTPGIGGMTDGNDLESRLANIVRAVEGNAYLIENYYTEFDRFRQQAATSAKLDSYKDEIAASLNGIERQIEDLENRMGKGDSPAVIAQKVARLRSDFDAFLEGHRHDHEEGDAEPLAEGMRNVTVQQVTPLVYALVAGLVYGIVGAAGGAATALTSLQIANGEVPIGAVLTSALAAGLLAFVSRTMEGVRDQGRSQEVSLSAPVASAQK